MSKHLDQYRHSCGDAIHQFQLEKNSLGSETRFTVFTQSDCLTFVREIRREGEEEWHEVPLSPGFSIPFELMQPILETFGKYNDKKNEPIKKE